MASPSSKKVTFSDSIETREIENNTMKRDMEREIRAEYGKIVKRLYGEHLRQYGSVPQRVLERIWQTAERDSAIIVRRRHAHAKQLLKIANFNTRRTWRTRKSFEKPRKWLMTSNGSSPETRPDSTESRNKRSATGQKQVKLHIEQRLGDIDGITCPAMPAIHPSGHGFCMPGCLQQNRSLILNGRSISCSRGFQITNWFPTLDPESTSRGLACVPYWDGQCADLSQRLWSPTGTGSRELDSALWSSSCTEQDAFSQSLKILHPTDVPRNSQKTSLQCSPTSPPSTTGDARIIVRKIKLRPDAAQKEAFRFFFGATRYFWNKAKSVADKISQEALEARCAELSASETGLCRVDGCSKAVKDPHADHTDKARWWCENHVDDVTFGAKARIMPRSRPYEKLMETFDGICLTLECTEHAEEDAFRCSLHAQSKEGKKQLSKGARDPTRPSPISPYNFEGIKSIICPPSEELLANEKWQDMVPCNTKTAAIKAYTSACASTFTKWRKGDMSAELPDFRRRKDYVQTFAVRDNAISFKRVKARPAPQTKKRKRRQGARKGHLKSRFRAPRPRGERRPGWELRIFPQQKELAGDQAEVSAKLASATRTPIRLKRQDMVRLKRAAQIGVTGSQSDWREAAVQRDRGGHHHLLLPVKVSERETSPVWTNQSYRDVFLDPGGRTFMTAYSPDGVAAKIGDDFYAKIFPKLLKADRIMSYAQAHKKRMRSKKYKRLLQRAHALRTKVRNCVRDLHRKTSRFLCTNFTAIHLPKFDAAQLATSTGATASISSKAVRNLMAFAHAEFLATLQCYAKARGIHVILVGEAYTTKTCPDCGHQNLVGDKKRYKCAACNSCNDRDLVAAKSITIRTTRFSA